MTIEEILQNLGKLSDEDKAKLLEALKAKDGADEGEGEEKPNTKDGEEEPKAQEGNKPNAEEGDEQGEEVEGGEEGGKPENGEEKPKAEEKPEEKPEVTEQGAKAQGLDETTIRAIVTEAVGQAMKDFTEKKPHKADDDMQTKLAKFARLYD